MFNFIYLVLSLRYERRDNLQMVKSIRFVQNNTFHYNFFMHTNTHIHSIR